jgi:hypothetical protein
MSERESAQREREGAQQEWAVSEREGAQRERGAMRAGLLALAPAGLSEERTQC